MTSLPVDRASLTRRSQWLTSATLGYNSLEAILAIIAGLTAGSVALVGFGFDSTIELSASLAALWRLSHDADPAQRAKAEYRTIRFIGICFLVLAAYVLYEAVESLIRNNRPSESLVGIVVAAASLVVMPLLARAKRQVGFALASGALVAEAKQTELCAYLSAILLGGLVLNATLGWWWADPVAALVMVPIIVREGILALRGESPCCDDCTPAVTGQSPEILKQPR